MILRLALLLSSAVLIYLACEFFVNGVECSGHRFGVSRTAVGRRIRGQVLPSNSKRLVR